MAYLVMDFVEGLSLSELLARREANGQPFTESDLLNVIRPVLEGLQVIHAAGVYHRDIKPSNILIRRSDRHPVLIDFGAAKQVVSGLTKSLAPYTDGYAAMEQVGEGEIGPWTDLYGLGAVMWRMVAGGSPPWTPPNPLTVQRRAYALMQGQEDPMPPAQQIGARRFTRNLLQTIDACLAVSHSSRLSGCTDLMYALNPEVVEPPAVQPQTTSKAPIIAVTRGITTGQKRTPAAESRKGPRNRSYAVWVLLALSLIIVIGIFGYAITRDAAQDLESQTVAVNQADPDNSPGSDPKMVDPSDQEIGVPSSTAPNLSRVEQEEVISSGSVDEAASDTDAGIYRPRPMALNLAAHEEAEEFYQMGEQFYYGDGVTEDEPEAMRWYRLAADLGHADAQYSLGVMYDNGESVPEDNEEAIRWYGLAAGQGHSAAQLNLGVMYATGEGVQEDDREAAGWFRMAAEQGNAEAQFGLAVMYDNGEGVTTDDRAAVQWYHRAADQGHAGAQFNLGVMYTTGEGVPESYLEAVKWFRMAAEQGDADAQVRLGNLYDGGIGVPLDDQEAVTWYRLAADQGHSAGQFYLGTMYDEGEGVRLDDRAAVSWYRLAADQGYAPAQSMLGAMYAIGEGVPESSQEAVKWYRRAAAQGEVTAQFSLGMMYDEGEGVTLDDRAAVRWYRRAAEQGYGPAQWFLGVMYATGEGLSRDQVQALAWLTVAAAAGVEEAAAAGNELRSTMTADQVAQAQSLSTTLVRQE